jgi:hypothetical protein
MRQWLEAGYFKGDLPISQVSVGPFHPLSAWFPDLNFAFRPNPSENGKDTDAQAATDARAAAEKAELERRRKAAEEAAAHRERLAAAEAAERAVQKEAAEREAAARELERQQQEKEAATSTGGNESSAQLKMMLGLSAVTPNGDGALNNQPDTSNNQKGKKKQKPNPTSIPVPKPSDSDPQPATPAPAQAVPAAPAWGGVKNSQPRKSMSEIQQEEARTAAIMAAQRGNAPQPSSGWANVASKGTSGWSGGAVVQAVAIAPSVRPVQARPTAQPANQSANSRKIASVTQQHQHQPRGSNISSAAPKSSNPAEEFGITMSPALEKWCKEKMVQINGSDDITLVGFCMTLNDANEIRQYLTTYLGSSPAVFSFATEFINKRGLGSKQEEWETPGSAKKGRKKKGKA